MRGGIHSTVQSVYTGVQVHVLGNGSPTFVRGGGGVLITVREGVKIHKGGVNIQNHWLQPK